MKTLLSALRCLLVMCMAAATHFGFQCPDGTPGPCGKPKPTPTPTPRPPPPPPRSSPSPPPAPPPCYEASLLVNCGLPGCLVSLNGAQRQTSADQNGNAHFPGLAKGKYAISASKAGHDYAASTVQLECGDNRSVELKPLLRSVTLRIRTAPPQCEILIDRQAKGRSDAQGLFNFQAASLSLMIEARKEGFLSATRGVQLEPGKPEQEIVLALDPIPALLTIVAALDSAQVRVDQQPERRPVNEEIALTPGRHQLTVESLGHKAVTLEVDLLPGAKEKREVKPARLAVAELAQQAEAAFQARAYANVMKLCNFMFEADAAYPPAHRLAGLTYAVEQNYSKAGDHLARARAGGEPFSLPVRRHLKESFDPARGHDACQAVLVFGKERVNFKGLQVGTEDFNVPYSQVQMLRLEPRSRGNLALALSAKVTLEDGRNKRDYSFFSPDKEVSAAGKAYLEMLQRLLQLTN